MQIARRRLALAFAPLVGTALAAGALAQDRPAAPPRPTPDAPDTIYVPYKDLEKVFETEGQGVFLPYKQFLALWRASRPPGLAPTAPPPIPAAVTGAEYEGTVAGTVATFTARYDVQVLADGWTELPLDFGNLALARVDVAGPPGALLTAGQGGHRFLAPAPGTYRLTVQFATKVEEKPGIRAMTLTVPPAPRARFDLRLPGIDLGVDLEPNLAATIEPVGDTETRVLAFLGPAAKIGVTWRPRTKVGAGRKPLVFAQTATSVRVDEGAVQVRCKLAYSVLQAPVSEFQLRVPADYQVLSLEGANLRDWDAKADGTARLVTVRLHSPVEDRWEVTLLLERLVREIAGDLPVPLVEAVGAERERGIVAVGAPTTLAVAVGAREGLTQTDPGEVPDDVKGALPDNRATLAFRYLGGTRSLTLAVSRVTPRVRAEVGTVLGIGENRRSFRANLALTIERAGLFSVRCVIPAGWDVLEILPSQLVDDHRLVTHAEGQLLTIDLRKQTLGACTLQVELTQTSVGPTGKVALPWIRLLDAEKETGRLGVALLPGHKATTVDGSLKGYRSTDLAKLAESGIQPRAGEELTLAFEYTRHPLAGTVEIARREAHVTAHVYTQVRVEENVCKITWTVAYTIQHAGVRQLVFALPDGVPDATDKITGTGIKQKRPPEAIEGRKEKKYVVELAGDTTGTYDLQVKHELKLGQLAAGQHVVKVIPALRVLDVFTEDGSVAVTKGENVVCAPAQLDAFDPIDPRELKGPLAALTDPVVLALRYVTEGHVLGLSITKYDFSATVQTAVNHLHVDAGLIPDGTLRVEAWLHVQNVQRQNLAIQLPAEAQVRHVVVAGTVRDDFSKTETPGRILVDLSAGAAGGAPRGTPFVVRVRYDLPRPSGLGMFGGASLVVPTVVSGPDEPVVPISLCTVDWYLPDEELRWLGFSTDLRRLDERKSLWGGLVRLLGLGPPPVERHRAEQAVQNLKREASQAGGVVVPFMPSGTPRKFLRHDGGGSVSVSFARTWLAWVLDALLFLGTLLACVRLPTAGSTTRLGAIAAGVGLALVASALSEALTPFAAAALVGAVGAAAYWLGYALLYEVRWNRDRNDRPPRPPAPPAEPPPPAPVPFVAPMPSGTTTDEEGEGEGKGEGKGKKRKGSGRRKAAGGEAADE